MSRLSNITKEVEEMYIDMKLVKMQRSERVLKGDGNRP